jgi:hypothetical protein
LNGAAREVFCYLGRLTLGGDFGRLISMLPLDEQELVRAVMSEIEPITDEEVRRRLIRLRQTEVKGDE